MFKTLSQRIQAALAGPPKKTQASLAKACGISAPSVNAWVKGETKTIEGENLLNAAKFLGVSARWLASGEGPMRPTDTANEDRTPLRCIEKKHHADIQQVVELMTPLSETNKKMVLGAVIAVISTLPPAAKKTG